MPNLLSSALLMDSSLSKVQPQWLINSPTGIYALSRRENFQSHRELNLASLGKFLHEFLKHESRVCVCVSAEEVVGQMRALIA